MLRLLDRHNHHREELCAVRVSTMRQRLNPDPRKRIRDTERTTSAAVHRSLDVLSYPSEALAIAHTSHLQETGPVWLPFTQTSQSAD